MTATDNDTSVAAALMVGTQRLQSSSSSARLDAELLLAYVLQVRRERLHAYPEKTLTEAERCRYVEFITQRAAGCPLAYLVGKQAFYTLDLMVNSSVLIPRPETECMVEWVLTHCPEASRRFVDLGTGSGAIALSVAAHRPLWSVVAVDQSAAALQVARRNAEEHGLLAVELLQSDWFSALSSRQFDVVVANPPYIAPEDAHLAALTYEPRGALVAADNGMADLRHIIMTARAYTAPGAWLLCEHGADQGQAVVAIARAAGWQACQCCPDLAGRDRFLVAQAPSEGWTI